jgi:hypothetical protein
MFKPLQNHRRMVGLAFSMMFWSSLEAARVAHEGFPDPETVDTVLRSAGHVSVGLTAAQVEKGLLLLGNYNVFLVGRGTTFNGASALYVQQVGKYLASGGNIVTEFSGLGIFFSSFSDDVRPWSVADSPQLGTFSGMVHGGSLNKNTTPITELDPTHPVVAGLPNPFSEFDGEDYFFWIQSSDPKLVQLGYFVGSGNFSFPSGQKLPCLLCGHQGHSCLVFGSWDWSDTIGGAGVNRKLFLNSVGFAAQGFNQPPVCNLASLDPVECQGLQTAVVVDGSRSSDPDGDSLSFLWASDCPGASFSDLHAAVTSLTVDTSASCSLSCTVTLTVDDGRVSRSCSTGVAINDSTPPVIALNGAGTMVLEAQVDTYTEPGATVHDNCDRSVSVAIGGSRVNTSLTGTYQVTYDARDRCGNWAAQVIRTVQVRDTIPPMFTSLPNDLTLECPGPAGVPASRADLAAFLSTAEASDTCDPTVPVTNDAPDFFVLGDTKVTWTARDKSGNTVTASRFVHVVDTTAPALACPSDHVLEAPGDTSLAAMGLATATEGCSDVELTYSDETTPGCGNSRTIRRTWLAVDGSGNRSSCVQNIEVKDTVPPAIVLQGPAFLVLECRVDTYTEAGATALDAGDGVVPVVIGGDQVNTSTPGTYVVTYDAQDACGNSAAQVTRTVRVADTIPPTFAELPDDLSVECEGPGGVPVTNGDIADFLATAVASDSCDGKVPLSSDAPAFFPVGDTTVTWTARDLAGNSVTASRLVQVVDTNPPLMTIPANLVLDYPADTSVAATGSAVATDTCGEAAVTLRETRIPGCGSSVTIKRLWIADDGHGNSTSDVQTITVVDRTGPVITLNGPGAMVLQSRVDSYLELGATASDAVDGEVAVVIGGVVNTAVPGTYLVTYNAQDACGNHAAQVARTVQVVDTIPPTFVALPNDLTLECPGPEGVARSSQAVADFLSSARASDTCDPRVLVTSDAPQSFTMGDTTVTWTARDFSGNAVTASRVVHVVDTTPPVLSCPPTAQLECPADTSVAALGSAGAEDLCGGVKVTYSDLVAAGCGNTETISRTWTATDASGNSAFCVQTIRVVDTTAPVVVASVQATSDPWKTLIHFSAGDACSLESVTAVVDTGCRQIAVQNGQLLALSCNDFSCADDSGAHVAHLTVTAMDGCGHTTTQKVDFATGLPCGGTFLRGDADGNGLVNQDDAVYLLGSLLGKGPVLYCKDAADANDDGNIDITDVVYLLHFLHRGGPAMPPPYPTAGQDPTPDSLDCQEYPTPGAASYLVKGHGKRLLRKFWRRWKDEVSADALLALLPPEKPARPAPRDEKKPAPEKPAPPKDEKKGSR